MAETLAQTIRNLERVYANLRINNPAYSYEVEEKGAIRSAFEAFNDNQVVKYVRNGKTTFSKAYKEAFERQELNPDLAACIGEYSVENPSIQATAVTGIFAVGLGTASAFSASKSEKINRREYIAEIASGTIFGALFGGVGGITIAAREKYLQDRGFPDTARYLDIVHTRFFAPSTASREPLILDRRGFLNTLYQRA